MRRREEYSAELRAQIAAKEAARQLEQTRRPAAVPSFFPAAGEPADLPTGQESDGSCSQAVITDTDTVMAPALPACPTLTEKERFIAAMERGITVSPKNMKIRRRSVTEPNPAASAAAAAIPQHRPGSAGGSDEAALRAQQFKLELDQQIEEKKRLKALERERERQWEAEQEARLERERAQLRQQFEEEHAARRAKVAADQASGASKGGPGIQIYAPAPKKKPGAAAGTAAVPAASRKGTSPVSDTSAAHGAKSEVVASNGAPENPEEPQDVAPVESNAPEPSAAPPPTNDTAAMAKASIGPLESGDSAAMTAACAQLAGQVAELRRLHEAVQRELLLHKAVLDASKEAKLAAATTLLTLAEVPKSSIGGSSAFPILHSTAELRTEDSRPSSSQMPLRTQPRGVPGPALPKSKLGGSPAPWPPRPTHPVLAEAVVDKLSNLRLTESAATPPPMWIAAVPSGGPRPRPAPPALATAKLVPVWRSERLGFWKSAGKKLRKLTVTKTAGGGDGRWVEQEDSRSTVGG